MSRPQVIGAVLTVQRTLTAGVDPGRYDLGSVIYSAGRWPRFRGAAVVPVWLLLVVFNVICVQSVYAQSKTEVVDTKVSLPCGGISYSLGFAHHQTKLKGQDTNAEAFSVILKSASIPSKVFSLYSYGPEVNWNKRDNYLGKYDQKSDPDAVNRINDFLTMVKCDSPDAQKVRPLFNSATDSFDSLLSAINKTWPGASPPETLENQLSPPSDGNEFSQGVAKFGSAWDKVPDVERLKKERDRALTDLKAASGDRDRIKSDLATANGNISEREAKLRAARWVQIILGVLGLLLIVCCLVPNYLWRQRSLKQLPPRRDPTQESPVNFPDDIKDGLTAAVQNSNDRYDRRERHPLPRKSIPDLNDEQAKLIEEVETAFSCRGGELPEQLSLVLMDTERQIRRSRTLFVRLRVRVDKGFAAAEKARAKGNYEQLREAVANFTENQPELADNTQNNATVSPVSQAPPELLSKQQAEELDTVQDSETDLRVANSELIDILTGGISSRLKETIVEEIKALLKTIVDEEFVSLDDAVTKISLLREQVSESIASQDLLAGLRSKMPFGAGNDLNSTEVAAQLEFIITGIKSVRRLAPPERQSTAQILFDEIELLVETYDKLKCKYDQPASVKSLLEEMDTRVEIKNQALVDFDKILAPVTSSNEDVTDFLKRLIQEHKEVERELEGSIAFQHVVGGEGYAQNLSFQQKIEKVLEVANQIPAKDKEVERQKKELEGIRAASLEYSKQANRLESEKASATVRLEKLEESNKAFLSSYSETVNGFFKYLGFRRLDAGPGHLGCASVENVTGRAEKALSESILFKSLRLNLIGGTHDFAKAIIRAEGQGRSDVIKALLLQESEPKLGIAMNLRLLTQKLESFDGDRDRLWKDGLLAGFDSGWLHNLLRADRLLQTYFSETVSLRLLRDTVKNLSLHFEIALQELNIDLYETKLLSPKPANRDVAEAKIGYTAMISSVPEIFAAVKMTEQKHASGFVVDITHFGLGGNSGASEQVRIALMNPSDWSELNVNAG